MLNIQLIFPYNLVGKLLQIFKMSKLKKKIILKAKISKNSCLQVEGARFGSANWMKFGGDSVFTEMSRFIFYRTVL